MSEWKLINTAPKDGSWFMGRSRYSDKYSGKFRYVKRRTAYGKTSHVPLYGWVWGRNVEDMDLWSPTHWMPIPEPPKMDASKEQHS